jgi:small GTP-binding protein
LTRRDHNPVSAVKLVRVLKDHTGEILSLAFDPAGEILASGGSDGVVRLWDPQRGWLLRKLEFQPGTVLGVAFNAQGSILASASIDHSISLWEPSSGQLLRNLKGHEDTVSGIAFDPVGHLLASGSYDDTVRLWDPERSRPRRILSAQQGDVSGVAFDPAGQNLASCGHDGTIQLWEAQTGNMLRVFEGHTGGTWSVGFDATGHMLASGGVDHSIKLWNAKAGRLLRTLEGHTDIVDAVAFSPGGKVLASKSQDGTVRLWRCDLWESIVILPAQANRGWNPALAFHPVLPLLATVGSATDTPEQERGRLIHLWEWDLEALLHPPRGAAGRRRAVHHTTAKIVLVGDHSVGKSGLGYRLVHGTFKEQASSHGQQFWVFPDLGGRRADGTECEAILWDLAGQPDYRLVHALFLDDADLALVLFDAADIRDPLHGVGFWLKQLRTESTRCPVILVAAQTDRGSSTLTSDELAAFCAREGIVGPLRTSALTGEGLVELVARMKSLIPWDAKPTTVTTATFKRIKDYVLGLKEAKAEPAPDSRFIVSPAELRGRLTALDAKWRFTDDEMLTAVGHLENYGYVKELRTSQGERRILLAPELLNNLASSFVLEARRNPRGLGSLEERQLFGGSYAFPELDLVSAEDCAVLLDSATLLFLRHNVCFREIDPLSMESYLVFPELINLKKPLENDEPSEDAVAYTVSGATENVFASLVVLLGYTHTFTRTNQWQNHARYQVGDGLRCGFRQQAEREGELDFVLDFGISVGRPVRTLFQGLFESFLTRRDLTVLRYEAVRCTKGHVLDRSVVRDRLKESKAFAFCNECGERLTLPTEERIQLTREQEVELAMQRAAAAYRTRFEEAIFRVRAHVAERGLKTPECFISYAWGVPVDERWVERALAADLQKAGIDVVLDRWENARVGASVSRFVERIEKADRVVVVGTPSYRRKYENRDPGAGFVVAAEVDVISNRLLGAEQRKETVLPVLLSGAKEESLPPLLHGRVHADFRDQRRYFVTAFDLLLSLYGIPVTDRAVADLRESLDPDSTHGPAPGSWRDGAESFGGSRRI